VAGGRTHIGTYVGVSPSPASNENNKIKKRKNYFAFFYFGKVYSERSRKVIPHTYFGIILLFQYNYHKTLYISKKNNFLQKTCLAEQKAMPKLVFGLSTV
jgi:hypothetical protein